MEEVYLAAKSIILPVNKLRGACLGKFVSEMALEKHTVKHTVMALMTVSTPDYYVSEQTADIAVKLINLLDPDGKIRKQIKKV